MTTRTPTKPRPHKLAPAQAAAAAAIIENAIVPVPAPAPSAAALEINGAHAKAARAMWKGAITFLAMTIPVSILKATESRDVAFCTLHKNCGERINMQRHCKVHGQLGEGETERGYEYANGNYVVVSNDDLEKLPVPSKKTVAVEAFVPVGAIDPIRFETTYRVQPEQLGLRPFSLLLHTLRTKGVCAVSRVTLRTKETLCLLRADDEGLAMITLYYDDELRHFAAPPQVLLTDQEVQAGAMLVDMLSVSFDPSAYRDSYRDELLALIQSKVNAKAGAGGGAPAPTLDLMAALKASIEKAKSERVA